MAEIKKTANKVRGKLKCKHTSVLVHLRASYFSDRKQHRTRRGHERGRSGSSDSQNTAFDVVAEIRRSNDGLQQDADGLPRALQGENPTTTRHWYSAAIVESYKRL